MHLVGQWPAWSRPQICLVCLPGIKKIWNFLNMCKLEFPVAVLYLSSSQSSPNDVAQCSSAAWNMWRTLAVVNRRQTRRICDPSPPQLDSPSSFLSPIGSARTLGHLLLQQCPCSVSELQKKHVKQLCYITVNNVITFIMPTELPCNAMSPVG